MATPFSDVFKRAVYRFKDYDYLRLSDDQVHEVMAAFLNAAIADFAPVCLVDLYDIDETLAQFNNDLSMEVQEILALGIAYHWTSARILDQELLRNSMSTKDYTYFSPANLLRESQTLRDSLRKEYRDRITQYTYHHGDIAGISAST